MIVGTSQLSRTPLISGPRSFNPMSSIPGLSNTARAAAKDVFEAMSDWRPETVDDSEKTPNESRIGGLLCARSLLALHAARVTRRARAGRSA